MPKVDVYDIEGKKVSTVELKDEIFGIIIRWKDYVIYWRKKFGSILYWFI